MQSRSSNRPAAGYDRPFVGWLSLAQLISWGSVFYLFGLVMPPVEEALQVTRAQASLGFSIALLVDGLVAFPVGRLVDRGRERAVMTTGSLILAAGLACHTQVQNLASFYAVWAVLGLGMGCSLYATVFSVVTRRFPQDFRRAIITMTFLGGLASTVFIPLTAWLMAHLGWRDALWVLAAFNLLVCAPLHWHWLRGAPQRFIATEHNPDDEGAAAPAEAPPSPAGTSAPVAALASAPGPSGVGVAAASGTVGASGAVGSSGSAGVVGAVSASAADPGLLHHLKSPPYLLIATAIACMTFASAGLPSHMIALLRGYGMAEAWVVAVPALIGALQVLGRLLLYFFEHRFDVHAANRAVPLLLPLGVLALLAAPLVASPESALMLLLLALFVLCWGMGNGMVTIVKGTAMAQYVSQRHVASLNGAMGVPLALVRASAPLAMGLMWSTAHGYRTGLIVMVGTGLAGVAALVAAQRRVLR